MQLILSMILCCMLDAFMLHWNIFHLCISPKIISCCRCSMWNAPAKRNFAHKYFMGIPWGIFFVVVYFINQKHSRIVDNDGILSASKWCIMVEFRWIFAEFCQSFVEFGAFYSSDNYGWLEFCYLNLIFVHILCVLCVL